MSNIFVVPPREVYDLKGSWIDRGGKKSKKEKPGGKDMDFKNSNKKILLKNSQEKQELLSMVKSDSEVQFTEEMVIMIFFFKKQNFFSFFDL